MPTVSLGALEDTLKSADSQTRQRTLRAVADLFLGAASRLSDEKVEVFDNVFGSLIKNAPKPDLIDVSRRMAPVENAPRKLIRTLAENPDISIAGPILSQSPRLSTGDLCRIAKSKSNLHMLAISCRTEISEPITEILLERGDQTVARSVVGNAGAKLSTRGIEQILDRAQDDHSLVKGLREHKRLSQKAIREVEVRLTAAALGSRQDDSSTCSRDRVLRAGGVTETQILEFAVQNDYDGLIAALSALAKLRAETVENMMQPNRLSGVVLLCKAAGLALKTVDAIMTVASSRNYIGDQEVEFAHREFINLSRSTAERIVRFWQVRESIGGAV